MIAHSASGRHGWRLAGESLAPLLALPANVLARSGRSLIPRCDEENHPDATGPRDFRKISTAAVIGTCDSAARAVCATTSPARPTTVALTMAPTAFH